MPAARLRRALRNPAVATRRMPNKTMPRLAGSGTAEPLAEVTTKLSASKFEAGPRLEGLMAIFTRLNGVPEVNDSVPVPQLPPASRVPPCVLDPTGEATELWYAFNT